MRRRLIPPIGALLLISAACSFTADSSVESSSNDSGGVIDLVPVDDAVPSFGAPPDVPDGPLADTLATDLDLLFSSLDTTIDTDAIARIGASGDARAAWLLTDLLRFVRPGTDVSRSIVAAWEDVTGRPSAGDGSGWGNTTSHLIAWDTPAPPDYVDWKRQIFEFVEPGWTPFFDDENATIDWRWVSWGRVRIDDRPLDRVELACPEGCIPALKDPALTDVAGGGWYSDDRLIFGVVVVRRPWPSRRTSWGSTRS